MTTPATDSRKGGNPLPFSRDGKNPGTTQGLVTLPFSTLSAAIENTPAEPEWVWKGFAAPGTVTVYAGPPKVGKTTLLFGLFASLTDGSDFLGLPTKETGVLLLTEERELTLADKARAFSLDLDRVHVLLRQHAGPVGWPDLCASAAAYCLEHGLGVIVVDTWDKWAPIADENNAAEANAALLPLQQAASDADVAVIIVHHHRKTGGSHGAALRGSNALSGGVDVIVELKRIESVNDSTVRKLEATGRFSSTPDEIVIRLGDDGYEVVDDALAAAGNVVKERLIAAVDEGISDVAALAEVVGVSAKTATKHLHELAADERVMREPGTGVKGRPLSFLPWKNIGVFHLSRNQQGDLFEQVAS